MTSQIPNVHSFGIESEGLGPWGHGGETAALEGI